MCFLFLSRDRYRQEIDVLQNNLEFLSQRIETNGTAASVNQDNQYASVTATANDNRYETEQAFTRPTHGNYSNYSPTATNDQIAPTGIAQSNSRTSPSQSVARDGVNYEGTVLEIDFTKYALITFPSTHLLGLSRTAKRASFL